MDEIIYLLLGSNEGDRLAYILAAATNLESALAGHDILRSSVYQTAAWGKEDQPAFLNMAIGMRTTLSADEVLTVAKKVEAAAGRQRLVPWGQRTLDIDILFYGRHTVDTPSLTVPHPQLQHRRFALVPLAEIAPGLVHPESGKTVVELLADCEDALPVEIYTSID